MYEQNENPWQNQDRPHQYRPPSGYTSNLLATASLVCSILAIVMTCCGGGFVFGALAIVFGLLSRGAHKKAVGSSWVGILIGSIALIISLVVTVTSYIGIIKQYGSFQNYMDSYTYTLEKNLGIVLTPEGDLPADFYGESDFL